jgi:hypothetical protein
LSRNWQSLLQRPSLPPTDSRSTWPAFQIERFFAAEKSAVTAACQHLVDDFLKPRFLPTIRPTRFNYPVDTRLMPTYFIEHHRTFAVAPRRDAAIIRPVLFKLDAWFPSEMFLAAYFA